MEKKFGFYPYPSSFVAGNIQVKPLETFDSAIARVARASRITNDWFYPPLVRERLVVGPISPIKPTEPPLIFARRYQLPPTHLIRHSGTQSSERLNFLILCIGFLLGMRLVPEPWGHFYRTPVEKHRLTGLIVSHRDVERCLPLFDKFWLDHNARVRRMMLSAINIFQLAASYEYQYEKFIFQYVALDSIYRIFVDCGHIPERSGSIIARGKKRRVAHSERPRLICKKLGVPLPGWVRKKRGKNANALSEIRNNLFHQGQVGEEPIGFGGIQIPGLVLSMKGLNCRALLYLLGLRDPYISSPVTTRDMHGLSIAGRK